MIEIHIHDNTGTITRAGTRERGGFYLQQGRSWVTLSAAEAARLREFLETHQ